MKIDIFEKINNIKEVESIYKINWKKKDQIRKIGPENEFPIIDKKSLLALNKNQIKNYFETLVNLGWNPKFDDQTKALVEVKKDFGSFSATITTDFGTGTLEINYPASETLFEAEEKHKIIVSDAITAAELNSFSILGYGIQPLSKPDIDLVANKGRYKTLNKRFWTRKHLRGKSQTDVLFHTLNSSAQTHLDIYNETEAIKAINAFNKAAPILIALMANSPIWEGRIDPDYKDVRELFWDRVVNIPRDNKTVRKGIPNSFRSLEDYVNKQMEFEPILSLRNISGTNRYVELFGNTTFREFIEKGVSKVYLPGSVDRESFDKGYKELSQIVGEVIEEKGNYLKEISPSVIDVMAHDSFTWYDARLKSEYGTIELRCCAQQNNYEFLTVSAIALGLIENLDKFYELINKETINSARNARISTTKYGLQGKYANTPIIEYATQLVNLAREGLMKRGLGEEIYLEPLEKRLKDKYSPADKAIDIFKNKGMNQFIEEISLKR